MNRDLHHLREDYQLGQLDLDSISTSPIKVFSEWFDQAKAEGVPEPNAMTLATADVNGIPSSRVVLLKSFDKDGFIFYTNYDSRKGRQMAENPHVGLSFLWLKQERQIRIEGIVSKISEEKSTAYFQSRPRGSQIGAWASNQSSTVPDRHTLEETYEKIAKQFEDQNVLPKPPNWGGYIVEPNLMEFWQGRKNRLHDRICYTKVDNTWNVSRLAP